MTYLKKIPAQGCKRRGDKATTQIVIRMDDDTFNQVRDRASRERTSFAEQVRILIEWGLETAGMEEA